MHVNFVINFLCCSSKFVRCLVYAFECNAIGKERCLKNFCVCYVRTYLDAFAIALVGSRRTYARRQHRHTYTHVLPSPVSFVWVFVSLSLSLLFSFSPATITENHWIHTHTRVRNFDFRYTFWCCFQQYISDDIIQYAIATNRQRASSRKSNTIFYFVRKMKTRNNWNNWINDRRARARRHSSNRQWYIFNDWRLFLPFQCLLFLLSCPIWLLLINISIAHSFRWHAKCCGREIHTSCQCNVIINKQKYTEWNAYKLIDIAFALTDWKCRTKITFRMAQSVSTQRAATKKRWPKPSNAYTHRWMILMTVFRTMYKTLTIVHLFVEPNEKKNTTHNTSSVRQQQQPQRRRRQPLKKTNTQRCDTIWRHTYVKCADKIYKKYKWHRIGQRTTTTTTTWAKWSG